MTDNFGDTYDVDLIRDVSEYDDATDPDINDIGDDNTQASDSDSTSIATETGEEGDSRGAADNGAGSVDASGQGNLPLTGLQLIPMMAGVALLLGAGALLVPQFKARQS